jgi:hypothetical protein
VADRQVHQLGIAQFDGRVGTADPPAEEEEVSSGTKLSVQLDDALGQRIVARNDHLANAVP